MILQTDEEEHEDKNEPPRAQRSVTPLSKLVHFRQTALMMHDAASWLSWPVAAKSCSPCNSESREASQGYNRYQFDTR
jgi:hypothetical protein